MCQTNKPAFPNKPITFHFLRDSDKKKPIIAHIRAGNNNVYDGCMIVVYSYRQADKISKAFCNLGYLVEVEYIRKSDPFGLRAFLTKRNF